MIHRITLAVMVAVLPAAAAQPQERPPVFKTATASVSVSVAVKRGNNVVAGLTAADFRLFDNGVAQRIDAVSIESVPVDVTLFMDTSGSTAGAHDSMKRAIARIAAMLRPADRFRLLTIGVSVNNPIRWRAAGEPFTLEMAAVPGVSLIYDAVLAALVHSVPPGRRHLVIALTDGQDCGSIVTPPIVHDVAARSEAVLHWVMMGGVSTLGGGALGAFCIPSPADQQPRALEEAVQRTGGEVHRGWFGNANPVDAFAKIFADFRQSYVLHYSPEGVPRGGWHQLRVEVPGGRYTVNARPGYYGGEK